MKLEGHDSAWRAGRAAAAVAMAWASAGGAAGLLVAAAPGWLVALPVLPALQSQLGPGAGVAALHAAVALSLAALLGASLAILHSGFHFKVAWRACVTGAWGGACLWVACSSAWGSVWRPPALYGLVLAAFHLGEFLCVARANPASLSAASFVLNHSAAWHAAQAAALLEWAAGALWARWAWKRSACAWGGGLAACAAGDALRKAGMLAAGASFTHEVAERRYRGHALVTRGVFRYVRHPAYAGWLLWAVGSQLLLANPLCCVLFALAGWRFFSERVPYEEATLVAWYGDAYRRYQRATPTGLPFIDPAPRTPSTPRTPHTPRTPPTPHHQ